jgi:hypothetical protein
MTNVSRSQLADDLLRRFAAAVRAAQLYSKGHPIIARNLSSLSAALQLLHGSQPTIVIGIVGDEIIVDDAPIASADSLGSFVQRLRQIGVERIAMERGVTADELATFVATVVSLEGRDATDTSPFPPMAHIRVGRVNVDQRIDSNLA